MQLFCDGHPQIAGFSEGLQPVLYKPQVLDEPVLASGSDVDASGASIYGSVIRDGGVYRMWYQAWPRDWDGRDGRAALEIVMAIYESQRRDNKPVSLPLPGGPSSLHQMREDGFF